MAAWPWSRSRENQSIELDDFPNVKRWFDAIASRPASQRGVEELASRKKDLSKDTKAREQLFGAEQYKRR